MTPKNQFWGETNCEDEEGGGWAPVVYMNFYSTAFCLSMKTTCRFSFYDNRTILWVDVT